MEEYPFGYNREAHGFNQESAYNMGVCDSRCQEKASG